MHLRGIVLIVSIAIAMVPAKAQMVPLSMSALSSQLQARIGRFNTAQRTPANARLLSGPAFLSADIRATDDINQIRRAIADELIGKGYDLWTGKMFTKCVTPNAITLRPLSVDGRNPHNIYTVRQIESYSEYQDDRSSGFNASITYKLVSFGGGTAESSGSVFKHTNKYIDIYIRYVGDEYAANEGTPTTAAIAAVGASDGNARFAAICGQQFISRVGFGVTLDARLAAEITINGSSEQNKADVSVGFANIISFGANAASEVQKISQKSSLSASIAGSGGPQPKPEELMEYARQFGANNPAASASQEIYIETTPYAQVAYKIFANFDDVANRATGTVLDLNSDRAAILQQRAELDTAMTKPSFFTVDGTVKSLAELTALRLIQSEYLDKLGDVWAKCRQALDESGIKACRAARPLPSNRPPLLEIALTNQTP